MCCINLLGQIIIVNFFICIFNGFYFVDMIQFNDFVKSDVQFVEEVYNFYSIIVGVESGEFDDVIEIDCDVIEVLCFYWVFLFQNVCYFFGKYIWINGDMIIVNVFIK